MYMDVHLVAMPSVALLSTVHPCTLLNDKFFSSKNLLLRGTTAVRGGDEKTV